MVVVMKKMGGSNYANKSSNNIIDNDVEEEEEEDEEEVKPSIFHEFLSNKESPPPPVPSASASLAASSSAGRGPISSSSDLASERQAGNHIEGIPFYGLRNDFSGPEIASRFTGHKRGNSATAFLGSSRNGLQLMRPESMESSHLVKMLRNAGEERPRRLHAEETFFGMHPVRPTSASLVLQSATIGRADGNASNWEGAMPISVGPLLQFPPRVGQTVPFGYQASSNQFEDANVVPSVISQAADEGSRTGIKGSRILSSIKVNDGSADKKVTNDGKQKSGLRISEPEPSMSQSRQGVTSASCQMTIFYGGQAHVFDDVHQNKADIIMNLAGSSGGSWTTNFAQKSAARPRPSENDQSSGENGINQALKRESRGRLTLSGTSIPRIGSVDRFSMLMPPGFHQGSTVVEDGKGPEPSAEKKGRL